MKRVALAVWLLALVGLTSCGDEVVISHAGWELRGAGVLCYESAPVLADLATNRVSLVTPAGTFVADSGAHWGLVAGLIPLPEPHRPWVPNRITSVPFTDEYRGQGYYRVEELPVTPATWRNTQLGGTPPAWIYAFKGPVGSERGCWIDPRRLGEIDWSRR